MSGKTDSRSRPDYEKVVTHVYRSIVAGRTHEFIWHQMRNYVRDNPKGADLARNFFGLTSSAHAFAAAGSLARLYDTDPNTLSLHYLLNLILSFPDDFQKHSPDKPLAKEKTLRQAVNACAADIDKLKRWRDKVYAHADQLAVKNPEHLRKLLAAEPGAVPRLWELAETIANAFSLMSRDVSLGFELTSRDDFKSVAKALNNRVRTYEERRERFERGEFRPEDMGPID